MFANVHIRMRPTTVGIIGSREMRKLNCRGYYMVPGFAIWRTRDHNTDTVTNAIRVFTEVFGAEWSSHFDIVIK